MAFTYQINQVIHGFRIVSVSEDQELGGRSIRMIHEKTGADLLWLDNHAENMVFSIAFRTLPKDSTGVFHIIEHSVLCGSRKYPVREPFVELLKSSMNTFLNAMTFPDMTMYPVSSRNFRDLMNLTNVYLDAVFHPAVLTDRKRFCQEGWHIRSDESGKPEFRGIVYNEMKGAMSDPDTMMDREISRLLFPDTCYGHNSGGDPEKITDLTQEDFKKQYKMCYHPSNAYIYLDGEIDPDVMLKAIDQSFTGYKRRKSKPEFKIQIPRPAEKTIRYEIGPDEEIKDHSHLTMARITGTWRDRVENLARSVVCDVLTGGNESMLKHAALERGLCQDLSITVDDTGLQSWISIHADNVTDGKENDILNLIEETGHRIAENGLDRNAIEASRNRMIFNLLEDDEPQGIGRCIRAMGTWLYGGDPDQALRIQPLIRELRCITESSGIDRIAADMLLNRTNMVILHTRPSRTAGEEKRQEEEKRLHRITDLWTDEERRGNERLAEELKTWQETPETEDVLKKLPVLKREDADIMPRWTYTEEADLDGTKVLIHRIPCNGVVYLRASFPLYGFSLEELTEASFFAGMLGRLPTMRHDAFSIEQEIKRYTGSFGTAVMTRPGKENEKLCTPYLMAFASALEENADHAVCLMNEILTQTITDGQEDRIRDIMIQNDIFTRQRIASVGHLAAVKSVLSQYSADGAVRNAISGEPAIRYIHRFALSPEKEMIRFLRTANRVMKEGINRKDSIISVAGAYDPDLKPLLEGIPDNCFRRETMYWSSDCPHMLGFRIPTQTGFTARGYRLSRCGVKFSGVIWLTGSILSLEYLWNRVRVQGGAYGAGFQTDRSGNVFSYSFRDPNPLKTIKADFGASAFLKSFVQNEKQLDKYIISALNELNPLLSPREESALADSRFMAGITKEETEKIRLEILNARGNDLIQCAEWLDQFAREGSVCIAASQETLKTCSGMEIREL